MVFGSLKLMLAAGLCRTVQRVVRYRPRCLALSVATYLTAAMMPV
jgi:hypothetical protein